MSTGTLLGRIRDASPARASRVESDDEIRVRVLESLRALLSSRVGGSPACPEYGIMSITDVVHSCPDALATVARSIKRTIELYEPRLEAVHVRPVDASTGPDLMLRFELTGQLVVGGRRRAVRFETVINAARQLTVR